MIPVYSHACHSVTGVIVIFRSSLINHKIYIHVHDSMLYDSGQDNCQRLNGRAYISASVSYKDPFCLTRQEVHVITTFQVTSL
jgi:hypothetical protein